MQKVEVGDHVKVLVKGETPWAMVLNADGNQIEAMLKNKMYSEYTPLERMKIVDEAFNIPEELEPLNDYKLGDVLKFNWHDEWQTWVVEGYK